MFLLPQDHWKVKITKHKGKGVFATKDIPAGTVIGDYLGKVIHTKQEEEYEKKHGFYSMYYHDNASVFPDPKTDGIHLINHSCSPNSWMYTYRGHTLYFSTRKIFKGEEITISYLLGPQDKECNPCTDICKCGSINCSQTMHMPEKHYNAWTSYDTKKGKETKTERIRLNKALPPLSSYPTNIPDHDIYTLFGCEDKEALSYADSTLPKKSELRTRMRTSGRYMRFPKLNMTVLGITEDIVVSKPN